MSNEQENEPAPLVINEGDIVSIMETRDEPILTISEVVRLAYIEFKKSKTRKKRIDRMIEFVEESRNLLEEIPLHFADDINKIEMLIKYPVGTRSEKFVEREIHYLLSRLIGKINREFKQTGRIIPKPIKVETIVRAVDGKSIEGVAPAPQEFSLLEAMKPSMETTEKKMREEIEEKEEAKDEASY